MKNFKSNSKPSTEAAQGMKKETCTTQFRKFNSPSFIVLKLAAMTTLYDVQPKISKQFELSRYRAAVGTRPSARFIKFRNELTDLIIKI